MNSSYDVFRRKSSSTRCSNNNKANLIMNAAGTTEVLHRRLDKDIQVNLIITNRTEGLGTAKVYSWVDDDLQVGDYFVWDKTHIFLVTDQENNVLLDKNMNKFSARECNVLVECKMQESNYLDYKFDAVFIGRGLNKANPFLRTREDNPALLVDTKDLIIFPNMNLPRFKSCMIKDQQWDVLDWDNTTASPIIYCTIEAVPVTLKQLDEEPKHFIEETHYKAGLKYEFETTDYYYTTDDELKIERFENKVIVEMPYNKQSISFNTKIDGQIVENIITIEQ